MTDLEKKNQEKQLLDEISKDTSLKISSRDELESELKAELEKNKPDMELVNELILSIMEKDGVQIKEIDTNNVLAEFIRITEERSRANQKKQCKRFNVKVPKWAAVSAAACLILFSANTVSASVYSKQNFLSAVVEYFDGGIKIDFNKKDVINLPVSEDDPYGIRTKCAEYGMNVMVPTYLPEGFELTKIDEDINDCVKICSYHYESNYAKFNISYKVFSNIDDMPSFGVPSDEHNITEENINGQNIIISKEDGQFTAVFLKDNILYTVFIDGLDYSEGQKVIRSYK